MKRAIARSRCEVSGKVYLPGDDMTVTEEQLAYLIANDAATEIKLQHAAEVASPSIESATIDAVHGAYAGKIKARLDKTGNG